MLARAGVRPVDITAPIVHATTLITNALIEGKAGRAGLVTTAGFGDTLLIRDEHRYDMYDLQIEFPAPPIPRALTFEIAERVGADGVVREPPDADSSAALTDGAAASPRSTPSAICLLNSYVNATNERLVAEHLRAELGVPVCISAEVSPQIREYPRMVTTACNAATMPVIGPYLDELQKWLSARRLRRVGADDAVERRCGVGRRCGPQRRSVSSSRARPPAPSPAAGSPSGSARIGCCASTWAAPRPRPASSSTASPTLTNTFEVARVYRFKKGSGFPVSVPSVDLVEIGAGGGSLARTDQFGLLKVGPESAGAEPGPASYGRGGTQPAVTDADVVLGLLDPARFLGGDMPLDVVAAPRRRRPRRRRASASTRRHGRRHPRDRQPEHGGSGPHARRRARCRSAWRHRCSPSAAPARSTRAAWPNCSNPIA